MVNIKILVGYHKPAKLYKSDIYVPIHLGRALATEASKDGKMSQEDYQWMLDNMIGDDTGDNISELNRYFCELTAIYWAWKNYDKLGNPDYIGLCHYRRLFAENEIASFADYDIIAPYEKNGKGYSSLKVFDKCHGTSDLKDAVSLLTAQHPQYAAIAEPYLERGKGYYYNMFIMKRELFFEYCETLFDILFKIHQRIDYPRATYYNQRMPGFVAERLTGIFIAEKEKRLKVKKCVHLHVEKNAKIEILPKFSENAVTVCLSADDNYAPYLLVTIASIKENRKLKDKYEIYILDGGISMDNKKHILSLADDNFFVRFVDINPYLDEYDVSSFSLNAHFSMATYYRFFISEIFKNFNRVLYLDCDLVVNHNLAELYGCDMSGHAVAAVPDIEMKRMMRVDTSRKMLDYLTDKLKMKNPESYFQAGVLLLDVLTLRKMNFTNKCTDRLAEIKNPLFVDQCVLNSVFDGDYQPLPMKWNVLWHLPYFVKDLDHQLSFEEYSEYFKVRKNPYVVHYSGAVKPWKNTNVELADVWWKYARTTNEYENLLLQTAAWLVKNTVGLKHKKLKYYMYKILSKVTFGKIHKKYKQKRSALKKEMKEIISFVKFH